MTRFPERFRASLRASAALRFAAAAAALAVALLWVNWGDRLVLRMEIESAAEQGVVTVYFDDGKGYREAATASRGLKRGSHRYELAIPASRINSFRIDPSTHDQTSRISNVEALSRGRVVKRFEAAALLPANEIAHSQVEDGGRTVRFTVRKGGTDPYFMVANSALESPPPGLSWIAAILFTALLAVAAVALVNGLGAGGALDPGAPRFRLGLVLALVLAMALVAATTHSVSPDEFSHLAAGRYYLDHWLPPKVGDPETLASYSVYGASYLNEIDIVYLVAAKFVVATAFMGLDEAVRFRLFNVALLGLCLLLAARGRYAAWLTLPLLCTAQAWYVFAYFNADAFGLAVMFLLAAALLDHFERSEAQPPESRAIDWRRAASIGVLLAAAFLCKKTFYPFIAFIAAHALWRSGFRRGAGYAVGFAGLALLVAWNFSGAVSAAVQPLMPQWQRAILAFAAAGCLAAAVWMVVVRDRHGAPAPRVLIAAAMVAAIAVMLRLVMDLAANGLPWEHSRALAELTERLARADFRPSAMGTEQSYFGLALAWKGVTLHEMLFSRFDWVSNVTASFFGVYGYMNIVGPAWLYETQRALGLVFVAAVAGAALARAPSRPAALLGLASIVLAIVITMVYSWVRDLQAQGRYLLVILPILGVMAAEAARVAPAGALELRFARAVAAILWVLGVVSFAFIGLTGMVRA